MSLATVVMMVDPPGEPRTRRSLPSFRTMVGVMAESGRLPGAMELAGPWMRRNMLGTPTLEVKSSISSLRAKARPLPAVMPEPKKAFRV